MKPKNIIAFLLTGLILMSLASTSFNGFAQLFSDNITFLKPFCKKQNIPNTNEESNVIEYENAQSVEITLICTTFIGFNNPSFLVIYSEDNYKRYSFTELIQLNLFDKRNYLPPRLA